MLSILQVLPEQKPHNSSPAMMRKSFQTDTEKTGVYENGYHNAQDGLRNTQLLGMW